jgi:hypothetical protein
VENRPNSSVTDFRRQLNKLQSTATPPRPSYRTLGRSLAPSPLQRPTAYGRPGALHHRQVHLHGAPPMRSHGGVRTDTPREVPRSRPDAPRLRTHGDPTGGHEHPHRQTHMHARHVADPRVTVRRRRSNVLFVLVLTTACTLFLAATTTSTGMVYAFALSFLALCGYVFLLAQLRQREAPGRGDEWGFWNN